VAVVQGNVFNQSRIRTVVCIPLTGNMRLANMPGNIILSAGITGLPQDSVANVSQILSVDRSRLAERVGTLPTRELRLLFEGIDTVLGR